MKGGIIIFIKNPIEGHAKTRLAKDLGSKEALEVYKRLLTHTRNVVLELDASRMLYYSRFVDLDDEWPNEQFSKTKQEEGDLGLRMRHAFAQGFDDHDKLVIIGSDCPGLQKEHIVQAFKELDRNDVVIGPSPDGGYYLLGLKSFYPDFFQDIPWSTEHVSEATKRVASDLGLSVAELEMLNDVDYVADLEGFEWLQESDT